MAPSQEFSLADLSLAQGKVCRGAPTKYSSSPQILIKGVSCIHNKSEKSLRSEWVWSLLWVCRNQVWLYLITARKFSIIYWASPTWTMKVSCHSFFTNLCLPFFYMKSKIISNIDTSTTTTKPPRLYLTKINGAACSSGNCCSRHSKHFPLSYTKFPFQELSSQLHH